MSSLEVKTCSYCRCAKASLSCGLCQGPICKGCTQFVSAETFSFMGQLSDDLKHTHYCMYCFIDKVKPVLATYNANMIKAKDIYIIEKAPRKPLPIMQKSVEPVVVEKCKDRQETIMRLAYQAAEKGFNAVIKTKISYVKIRNAGYQKMEWSGTGFPVILNSGKYEWNADSENFR